MPATPGDEEMPAWARNLRPARTDVDPPAPPCAVSDTVGNERSEFAWIADADLDRLRGQPLAAFLELWPRVWRIRPPPPEPAEGAAHKPSVLDADASRDRILEPIVDDAGRAFVRFPDDVRAQVYHVRWALPSEGVTDWLEPAEQPKSKKLPGAEAGNGRGDRTDIVCAEITAVTLDPRQRPLLRPTRSIMLGGGVEGTLWSNPRAKGVAPEDNHVLELDMQSRVLDGACLCRFVLERRMLVDSSFKRAFMYEARLGGSQLESSVLDGADLRGASLDGCNLDEVSLRGALCHRASIRRAHSVHCYFGSIALDGADLSHTWLSTHVSKSSMRGAVIKDGCVGANDWWFVDARDVDFGDGAFDAAGGVIKRADFAGARMRGGNFEECDASWTDFSGADLAGAQFRRAALRRANLSLAKLSGADFTGADLARADLRGADTSGAVFADATLEGALRGPAVGAAPSADGVGADAPVAAPPAATTVTAAGSSGESGPAGAAAATIAPPGPSAKSSSMQPGLSANDQAPTATTAMPMGAGRGDAGQAPAQADEPKRNPDGAMCCVVQ